MFPRSSDLVRPALAALLMVALASGLSACAGFVPDNTPRSPIFSDHGGLNG
jgi:hypothetical protein